MVETCWGPIFGQRHGLWAPSSWWCSLTTSTSFPPASSTTSSRGARQCCGTSCASAILATRFAPASGSQTALLHGRDPYGCVPEIIAQEQPRGVRSSFQVAVARRHPADVNYDIRDDRTRDYLRAITDARLRPVPARQLSLDRTSGVVCRGGRRCSRERLARPLGSRQHFLSFDYDALFARPGGGRHPVRHVDGVSGPLWTARGVLVSLLSVRPRARTGPTTSSRSACSTWT